MATELGMKISEYSEISQTENVKNYMISLLCGM